MSHPHSAFLFLLPCVLAGSLSAQTATGFRRVHVGRMEVTALLDGEMKLPASLLKGLDPAEARKLLGGKDEASTPVNAFLVRTGGHLILVDTGGTSDMHPALGHIQSRLKEVGVRPADIDAVLITHFHGDHTGGLLTASGKRAFPNAVIRVSQAESDYWLSPATLAALPEARKGMITQIKVSLAPYQEAGVYKPFAPGEAPFQGVKALEAVGHTPGHTVYQFGEGAHAFWAVGDIVHFGTVQFQHPDITVGFDWDTTKAAAARLALWQSAAKEGAVLGAAHLAFPGLGHVTVQGKAFAWIPLP